MICPSCGSDNNGCKDSRQCRDSRRRRYQCFNCGASFITYEISEDRLQAVERLLTLAVNELSAYSSDKKKCPRRNPGAAVRGKIRRQDAPAGPPAGPESS